MKVIYAGIYQYTCKNTNRKYIGSSINLEKRHVQHLSLLKNSKHIIKDFQNDFNKYGIESFKYEILEYVDNKDFLDKKISRKNFLFKIREIEQKYLNKYHVKEFLKNKKDTRFFKLLYNKAPLVDNKYKSNQKMVYQYDIFGNFLTQFENSHIAETITKIDASSIRRCCDKIRKSAGNFLWSYTKETCLPKLVKGKPIYQYDTNKTFIKKYNSITEAKLETKIDIRKEKQSTCILQGGYYWLFENESFPTYKKPRIKTCFIEDCKEFLNKQKKYGERKKFVNTMILKYNMSELAIQNWIHKISKNKWFSTS